MQGPGVAWTTIGLIVKEPDRKGRSDCYREIDKNFPSQATTQAQSKKWAKKTKPEKCELVT